MSDEPKPKDRLVPSAEAKLETYDPTGKKLTPEQRAALKERVPESSKQVLYVNKDQAKKQNRSHENSLTKDGGREIHKKIVQAFEHGLPLNMCAQRAGIHYDTMRRWVYIAKAVYKTCCELGFPECRKIEGELVRWFTPAEAACFHLYCDMMKAEGDAAYRAILAIGAAQKDDWRAAAFFLERRFPKEFKPSMKLEGAGTTINNTTNNTVNNVQVNAAFIETTKDMEPEEKKTLLAAFKKMKAKTAPQGSPVEAGGA